MKKTITILMALMVLFFTQCKPTPEGGDENSRKVKVSCSIPMGKNNRSDFCELMTEGNVRWSDGRECVYLAIHGENPQIIELESWADGNPLSLEFEGEVKEGLITSGEEYDIWYFGHSHRMEETPYYNLSDDGSVLTGSIAAQSGRLEDLGYCHIATTKVTAVTENDKVKLNLKGTLANQIAIALLDLENVDELYGDAILGTEYALSYNGERYELDVTEDNNANIDVESASGISYVVLLPNDEKETMIKHKKSDKTYAYTFHNGVKGNKVYYRTATNDKVALKWEEIEEEPETPDNNHEYVDLGLPSGLLWATCNVGANAPEEYGDYFAWGETEPAPNNNYSSSNCPTYGLDISQLQSQGYIDSEGNLTAKYDAATANWGGDWRMPTKAEQEELLNNCTWTWTTQNGVNGYKVVGSNGNSIFLPAAGYHYWSSLEYPGVVGNYWSSVPDEYYANITYTLNFSSDEHLNGSGSRYYGQSVRPVSGGNNAEPEEPETPETPDNNHEYVDLGLSVKWATCNVGANSPEAYGNYYAWGETEPAPNNNYSSSNCSTYGLSNSELQSQGYIDSKGNLTAQHDAATANWGGDWRMPTDDELRELRTQCTWTWTTQNGVNGYNVEGPNGNSIFLPAAGYRARSSLNNAGDRGHYWSSALYDSDSNYAYFLYFSSDEHFMSYYPRYVGQSVRPVCGGNNAEPEEPETPETPDHHHHEYVDLGLSVKWATCNVGAETPEAYGNYYAWGETEPAPNNNYSSSNCSTYGLSNSELQSQGYIDSKGNLTAKYDAATANWGGDWRMPTKAEQEELLNNCTWTWTTQKGVNGYKVVGSNGNSIFLPAAGRYYGSSLEYAGSVGFYWNSAPYESGSAYFLCFNSGNHEMYYDYRYNGQSVRPVLE